MEYGTVPVLDVMNAIRAEQWLNLHPETPADKAAQIKAQMLAAFTHRHGRVEGPDHQPGTAVDVPGGGRVDGLILWPSGLLRRQCYMPEMLSIW